MLLYYNPIFDQQVSVHTSALPQEGTTAPHSASLLEYIETDSLSAENSQLIPMLQIQSQ